MWMPNGTAVFYALNLDYFATPLAIWLRQFETLLQGLTYYVWTLEIVGPILIFSPILHRPVRALLMCCFITMHIGFFLFLEIGLFPFISIVMNLTFMPGWMWDEIGKRLRPKGSLAVWYDRDCGFCEKLCLILATFLFIRDVPIRPAQDEPKIGKLLEKHNSWVVTDVSGEHLKWQAMRQLVAGSPVYSFFAWPMGWRPVAWVGNKGYDWVARNRPRLSALSEALLPRRPVSTVPTRTSSILAALALALVTAQNISTLPSGWQLPNEVKSVRQFFGLYQNWTMFAPHPEITSPWPIIPGELVDGTKVDVYNDRLGRPSSERPEVISEVYRNYRWRKFLSNLEDHSYRQIPQRLALAYSQYLCRKWNHDSTGGRQLKTLAITFIVEWTNPPGTPKDVKTNTVRIAEV